MLMIAVLPQTEHLQRNANGLTAETQLQLAAGCFIAAPPCGPWVRPYPALSITTKQVSNSSIDQGGGKRRGNSATPILLRLTLYRWRFRIFDQESSRPPCGPGYTRHGFVKAGTTARPALPHFLPVHLVVRTRLRRSSFLQSN